MSRTYRKRQESFEKHYEVYIRMNWVTGREVQVLRYRYYTQTCKWHSWKLPQWYRNRVNRNRRRHDKREVWRELNRPDYENLCSSWNCKDCNSWGYW